MKNRNIYYRRKGKKIIVEGKMNKKTIFLFTLPEPSELLNASFLTKEKKAKITEKIMRLDIKQPKEPKAKDKVRIIDIMGIPEKDDEDHEEYNPDEEINELLNKVK